MKVLSLCDGMSCCHIALDRAGIPVEEYYASEIKDIGIKVTQYNYPDTIHIGTQGIKGSVDRSRIPDKLCEYIVELCEKG